MAAYEDAENLAYTDFSTDKAKDNAYMADQQKSDCKYNLRSGCAVAAKIYRPKKIN